jgi:hypothetical protein
MNATRRPLIIPPYIGEFGWELMNWQGRVRREIARSPAERIVLGAPPDRHLLYANGCPAAHGDARLLFCPASIDDLPGAPNEDHRIRPDGSRFDPGELGEVVRLRTSDACRRYGIDVAGAEWLQPDYRGHVWAARSPAQQFQSLRRNERVSIDVVLVPRRRDVAAERNASDQWWAELARRLASIGLTVETFEGPLDRAIGLLSRARLAAGASTGGLHLACLCRCPHYVWGCGAERRWTGLGITNRQRYETLWNPLGTPCVYDECGWRPDMAHVIAGIRGALETIGLSAGALRQHRWRARWHVRRQLTRCLAPARGRFAWPWRLQQLVRERLV